MEHPRCPRHRHHRAGRGPLGAAQLGRQPPALRARPDRARAGGGPVRLLGLSPSNNPAGGYREYGVDAIGLNPDGYASNNANTLIDDGFGDCRPAQPDPPPSAYTNRVVTPHASFLALPHDRGAALASLRRDFDAYGEGGFYDAVDVDTGQVSRYWLALDQGMIMAALANELTGDRLQRYFSRGRSSGWSGPCWPWRSSASAA